MRTFQYILIDSDGQQRHGVVQAESLVRAIEKLEADGHEIKAIEETLPQPVEPGREHSADAEDSRVQETATHCIDLVCSSVNEIDEWSGAMEPLAASWPTGDLGREVRGIKRDIASFRNGVSASTSSMNDIAIGKRLARALPYAMQDEGASLEGWARAVKHESERSGRLTRMLIYPIVLGAVAFAVCLWITFFVIPIFAEMFDEFALELPPVTQLLFDVSRTVTGHLPAVLIGCFLVAAAIIAAIYYLRKLALPTRLFGSWASGTSEALASTSFFSQSLAELIRKGVSTSEALEFAGRYSGHATLCEDALRLARLVENGASQETLERSSTFVPPTVTRALFAKSGKPSVQLLDQISASYLERSEKTASTLVYLFPPVAIICIGIFVGFVLLTLFAPLVKMVSSLA